MPAVLGGYIDLAVGVEPTPCSAAVDSELESFAGVAFVGCASVVALAYSSWLGLELLELGHS